MDVEKTVEFILEQMAGITIRLDRLAEAHQVLTGDMLRLAQNQAGLAEVQSRQQEMIGGLIAATQELAAGQRRLEQAQQHTDQNLNSLIKVVDELVRRDGRHPS